VTRTRHRSVPVVTPHGETIEALIDAIDEGPSREFLRAVVAGADVAGMRDGVDCAMAAASPAASPESASPCGSSSRSFAPRF